MARLTIKGTKHLWKRGKGMEAITSGGHPHSEIARRDTTRKDTMEKRLSPAARHEIQAVMKKFDVSAQVNNFPDNCYPCVPTIGL